MSYVEKEFVKIRDFLYDRYPHELGGKPDYPESLAETVIRMLTVADTPVYRYLMLTQGQIRRPEVMADLIEALLKEMGVPMDQGDVKNSPVRIAKGYLELTESYGKEKPELKTFAKECRPGQLMILKNLRFSSLCEHHMLPFLGVVSVGYVIGDKVIGLSKPARLVHYHSKKFLIQERFEDDVALDIMEATKSPAVFLRVEAQHLCSLIRGVKSPDQDAVNYREFYLNDMEEKKHGYKFDVFVKECLKE